jgi:tRNA-splicing ligase RtcB
MMKAALDAVYLFLGTVGFGRLRRHAPINCHHNYTALEHHRGKNVWITRKGAIKAALGHYGVIPGSMGTRSYIVSGLGNPASYNSCSHGAGRRLSRGAAKRQLTVESLEKAMEGKAWNGDGLSLLDEHPEAYKDIDEVMEAQSDLVAVVAELHQILNYKGV